jgi:hypothetical protein
MRLQKKDLDGSHYEVQRYSDNYFHYRFRPIACVCNRGFKHTVVLDSAYSISHRVALGVILPLAYITLPFF